MLWKRTASEVCQAWRAVKVAHFQFSTLAHTRWVFLVWSVSLWETPPLTHRSEHWREGLAQTISRLSCQKRFQGSSVVVLLREMSREPAYNIVRLTYKDRNVLRKPYSQLCQLEGKKLHKAQTETLRPLYLGIYLTLHWVSFKNYTFRGWIGMKRNFRSHTRMCELSPTLDLAHLCSPV